MEKNEWPRRTEKSRTLKKKINKQSCWEVHKYTEKNVQPDGRTEENDVLHECELGDSVDRCESKQEHVEVVGNMELSPIG